jgi:superfamily I DNA/RNA helicase
VQAIYGFRGAKASMLQDRFNKLFAGTSATYFLSDNYRSYSPIITVADGIRSLL